MSKTIEAMKLALVVMQPTFYTQEQKTAALDAITKAIAREEAQTVEPAKPSVSERDEKIWQLRKLARGSYDEAAALFNAVADMLASDAQEIERMADMHYAENVAMNAQQVAVPKGYTLVPDDPTPEMVQACDAKFVPRIALPFFVAAYKTMLAAAPQPPQGEL